MKFFHLADLHIGIKLYNWDLSEDQRAVLGQIAEAAASEKPDAIVLAGDIYDRAVPSAESVELFDRFVSDLTEAVPEAEILLISGNHDSAARINLFRRILSRQRVHCIGEPPRREGEKMEKVTLRDVYGPVHFYLLPFVKPSMVRSIVGSDEEGNPLSYNDTLHRLIEREEICEEERNVLVSHQFYLPPGRNPDSVERMDSEMRTVGNIDEVRADFFEKFDYVALGHIHKPMRVGGPRARYAGTPLPYSVSEAGQEKGIIEVEMGEKGEVGTRVLPLTPLRAVRVVRGPLEEVLREGCEDYVSVVLTDREDPDTLDRQDRLRTAFPHLLEIRRESEQRKDERREEVWQDLPDPFELCLSFLKETDEAERKILQDVINTVQEGEK